MDAQWKLLEPTRVARDYASDWSAKALEVLWKRSVALVDTVPDKEMRRRLSTSAHNYYNHTAGDSEEEDGIDNQAPAPDGQQPSAQ